MTIQHVFCLLGTLIFAALAGAKEPVIPERSQIEALIIQQLRSWETGDEAAFLETIHPEIVFAYPGKRLDAAGALEIFREWSRDFSDTKVYLHAIVIEGNRFSVEYQFASTRKQDNARSAAGTVSVGHVEDGRLRVWKEYLDGRVSRQQAEGALPVDEGAEPFPWPNPEGPEMP